MLLNYQLLLFCVWVVKSEYYSFGGSNNNIENPTWGSVGVPAYRFARELSEFNTYGDNSTSLDTTKPNPRVISNTLGQFTKRRHPNSPLKVLTASSLQWAQLLTFDICGMTLGNWNVSQDNYVPVDIPACDCSYLDMSFLYGDDKASSDAIRTFENGQIMVEPVSTTSENQSTILENDIFGSSDLWKFYSNQSGNVSQLQHYAGSAGLATASGENNESRSLLVLVILLHFKCTHTHILYYILQKKKKTKKKKKKINNNNNKKMEYKGMLSGEKTVTCPYARTAGISSTRGKLPTHASAASLMTIFAREHNRIASQLQQQNFGWTDDQLFDQARAYNIALFQYITYTEYLPLLLGKYSFPNQITAYSKSTEASASAMFCSAAYRFAHSAVDDQIPLGGYVDQNGHTQFGGTCDGVVGYVNLRDSFAHPCVGVDDVGSTNYVDTIVCGAHLIAETEIDTNFVEDLRSYLPIDALRGLVSDTHGKKETLFFDLLSTNIQRFFIILLLFIATLCLFECAWLNDNI
ncbi:peroxidase [Reticulomyxa filosa]|uniref:Peroxidase n=1 Tax=Reticulomyxa filosa TaxID=46433 RepID=X6P7F1_RETFI|nr:peroxidase [Reticulomyxa filosa]|eukprot:ETO34440.1 peroxidase [Reticulomyxa filosa]